MRLYLSSFKLGNHPERFTQLTGQKTRVAVIANARDAFPDEQRRHDRVQTEIIELKAIDLEGEELDLRRYVGKRDELKLALTGYGAVWILGGNVFVLRRAMFDSGFDEVIKELLERDSLVYAGYSAAAVVLASTLRGCDLVDPTSDVTDVLKQELIWEGLGVLPYVILPHHKSDHPESALIDDVADWLEKEEIPFKTLRDGEVLIVEGEKTEHVC